jgi:topoisomerase-4 subunit A
LRIPIRRISLYDINKAREEMQAIQARIKEINSHLKNIVAYSIAFLNDIIGKIKANTELSVGGEAPGVRKTKVGTFDKVNVKEVAGQELELKYDKKTGYLGTAVTGSVVAEVSPFDRILVMRKNGMYAVSDIPDKVFIGPDAWWIGVADKEALAETVFTIIYKEKETACPCIKRCVIQGWIMNKDYFPVPDGALVLHVDTRPKFIFTLRYVPKPRLKVLQETFKAQDFNVKGLKAGGVRISTKEVSKVEVK